MLWRITGVPAASLLLLLSTLFGHHGHHSAYGFEVGGFVDVEKCYAALQTADNNPRDERVVADEYVTFVQEMAPPGGFFDDAEVFQDLPLRLQTNFILLACLCEGAGEGENCCVGDQAHISTSGSAPGEIPTPEEQSYLYRVCFLTDVAITETLSSEAPSVEPSASPTLSPVDPSDAPTMTPTLAPVPGPTESPTEGPTRMPSASPSAPPTMSPTVTPPTPDPTPGPPTLSPSQEPTVSPSASPTEAPTFEGQTRPPTEAQGIDIEVSVSYDIAIVNGNANNIDTPSDELLAAMNDIAPAILSGRRRILRQGRKLSSVDTDATSIDSLETIDCPSGFGVSDDDRCETVTATFTLSFEADEVDDAQDISDDFQDNFEEAVDDGDLQDSLDESNPDTVIVVLSESLSRSLTPDDEGLSSGAIAGISIAAAVGLVALLLVGRYTSRSRGDGAFDSDKPVLQPVGEDMDLEGDTNAATAGAAAAAAGTGMLGATSPDYSKSQQQKEAEKRIFDMEAMGSGDDNKSVGSSNAGSSGWSSSAGVSSLNTGSVDELDDTVGVAGGPTSFSSMGVTAAAAGGVAGVTAAALAAAAKESSSTPDGSESDRESEPSSTPSVSRADIDQAIETGDWAAVGATAALLAAASDSQSMSSRTSGYTGTASKSGSSVSSLDAARAAELDHLVDAGDWEGVVLAAAKYEASEGEGDSNSVSGSESQSKSASVAGSSTFQTSSVASEQKSMATSPSKTQKREELRAQVEDLVRKVVPEEIQNVDEMMLQFRGREEELVETLRTMQERAVAQKARQSTQKAAKIQAKQTAAASRAAPASSSAASSTLSSTPAASASAPSSSGGLSSGATAAVAATAGVVAAAAAIPAIDRAQSSGAQSAGDKSEASAHAPTNVKSLGADSIPSIPPSLSIESGGDPSFGDSSVQSPQSPHAPTSVKTMGFGHVESKPSGSAKVIASGHLEETEREKRVSALERAIEAGDWEAVGEAAAMMSDNSMTSADSSEIARLAEGIGSVASSTRSTGVNSERAAELDSLIAQGNWQGVVSAADRYDADDLDFDQAKNESLFSNQEKLREQEEKREKRLKRMQEEQEALEQAEIWMAIAEQSRQEEQTESTVSVGAAQATDWAIRRSLNALVQAEQNEDLTKAYQTDDSSRKSGGTHGTDEV